MAITIGKRTQRGPLTVSRRPGQHYSLSPTTPRRLRTLPLPFEVVAPDPAENAAANTPTDSGAVDPAAAAPVHTPVIALPREAAQAAISPAQLALVAQLSREVKRIEVAGRVQPNQLGRRSAVFSSGCPSVDRCLPCGGYESGTLIEYLQNSTGSGATTLALSAAREALAVTDRFCVVIDWRQQFYPPAAAALGLDLKRIVVVRPNTLADRLWALDQALRSPAIVAVIAEVEQLDDRAARRLQLAAESGGSLGLLVRHVCQRHQPSWAEVQWLVRPIQRSASVSLPNNASSSGPQASPACASAHRQLQLELLRVRGGQSGSRVDIQVNSISGRLEPATAAASALARTLSRTNRPTTPKPNQALPA